MDIKTCRNCKRLFNYITGPMICMDCRQKIEEMFQDIKKYINEHDNVSITDLVDNFDVTEKQIRTWIDEGRLEFGNISGISFACCRCGTKLQSGKYCSKCKYELSVGLSSISSEPAKNTSKSVDHRTTFHTRN